MELTNTKYGGEPNALAELGAALAKAQAEITAARKDQANPFFRSKYADLAAIWDACRSPLTKNGLSVIQLPGYNVAHEFAFVTTILLHSSGAYIESTLCAPVLPQVVERGEPLRITPQSIGSANTYLRRYALASVVGVAPDDDDGEAASGRPGTRRHDSAPPPQNAPSGGKTAGKEATPKQLKLLRDILQSSVITDKEREKMETWITQAKPAKAQASKAIDHWKEVAEKRKTGTANGDETVPAGVQAEIDDANARGRAQRDNDDPDSYRDFPDSLDKDEAGSEGLPF